MKSSSLFVHLCLAFLFISSLRAGEENPLIEKRPPSRKQFMYGGDNKEMQISSLEEQANDGDLTQTANIGNDLSDEKTKSPVFQQQIDKLDKELQGWIRDNQEPILFNPSSDAFHWVLEVTQHAIASHQNDILILEQEVQMNFDERSIILQKHKAIIDEATSYYEKLKMKLKNSNNNNNQDNLYYDQILVDNKFDKQPVVAEYLARRNNNNRYSSAYCHDPKNNAYHSFSDDSNDQNVQLYLAMEEASKKKTSSDNHRINNAYNSWSSSPSDWKENKLTQANLENHDRIWQFSTAHEKNYFIIDQALQAWKKRSTNIIIDQHLAPKKRQDLQNLAQQAIAEHTQKIATYNVNECPSYDQLIKKHEEIIECAELVLRHLQSEELQQQVQQPRRLLPAELQRQMHQPSFLQRVRNYLSALNCCSSSALPISPGK